MALVYRQDENHDEITDIYEYIHRCCTQNFRKDTYYIIFTGKIYPYIVSVGTHSVYGFALPKRPSADSNLERFFIIYTCT